jgi:hypothetical protein
MTPKDRVVTFRPDEDLLQAMGDLQARDGIAFSEQIRRALRLFLTEKGVMKKTERPRAVTRKRS